jgi:hypothetical protein
MESRDNIETTEETNDGLGIMFFEASAKTGANVGKAFVEKTLQLCKQTYERESRAERSGV